MNANIYFLARHTFILSDLEKQEIWRTVEKLLTDNQVEASFRLNILFEIGYY